MPDADGVSFLDVNWSESLLTDAQYSATGAELPSPNPSQVSLGEQETRGWLNPEVFSPELRNALTHNVGHIGEELLQHDMNEM